MRPQPTQAQLQEAHRVSRLSINLESAMRSHALALALINTAIALSRAHQTPVRIDHKRRAAGDID